MNCRVYDCFTFYNELELLELRFLELKDVVDYFVICESSLTFTGNQKPLYFQENKERFSSFLHKVIHVVVDQFPPADTPWVREYFQRESVRRGLTSALPEDLIMISDIDEIPRAETVSLAKNFDGFINFKMNMYQFYMNLLASEEWTASFAFNWRYKDLLPDFSRARWVKDEVRNVFLDRFCEISNAGWHFTHLGGVDRLQQKFSAYSHANDPWPKAMKNKSALEKQILVGGKVGETKNLSQFVELDLSYPQAVLKRLDYYQAIGFIKNIYEAFKELQSGYHVLRKSYAIQCYGDGAQHPALGDLSGEEFLALSGVENPYEGRVRGGSRGRGELISLNKPASQSSLSKWSLGGTLTEDASGACNGVINGEAKFHTDFESAPWWMVDLQGQYNIHEVRIYNRLIPILPTNEITSRAAKLKIEVGVEVDEMNEIYRKTNSADFGGADGKPLIVTWEPLIPARYLRITLLEPNFFHLDQVEIYGEPT